MRVTFTEYGAFLAEMKRRKACVDAKTLYIGTKRASNSISQEVGQVFLLASFFARRRHYQLRTYIGIAPSVDELGLFARKHKTSRAQAALEKAAKECGLTIRPAVVEGN